MNEGQAYMFTPGGAVAIEQDGTLLETTGVSLNDEHPSMVVRRQSTQTSRAVARAIAESAPTEATPQTLRPQDVVRAARARVKQIRAELRNMKRLEKELTELVRLIAAAKQRPVALVRQLDQARHAR